MEPTFIKLINQWLPTGNDKVRGWNTNQRIRAKTYLFLNLVTSITCAAFTLLATILTITTHFNFTSAIIAGGISTIISTLIFYYFLKTSQLTASTAIFFTSFLIACLACVIISGGSNSPLLPLLICTPILAGVTSGRDEGLYYTGVTLGFIYVLLLLENKDFPFFQIMPAENRIIQTIVTWTITLSLNATSLFVYQYFYEEEIKLKR